MRISRTQVVRERPHRREQIAVDSEIAAGVDGGPRSVGLLGQSLDLPLIATQATLQVDQRSVNGLRVVVDGVGDEARDPQIGRVQDHGENEDESVPTLAEVVVHGEEGEHDDFGERVAHVRQQDDVEEGVPAADAVAHGRVLAFPDVRFGVPGHSTVDFFFLDGQGQSLKVTG